MKLSFLLTAFLTYPTGASASRLPASTTSIATLLSSAIILLPSAFVVVVAQEQDDVAECDGWASAGECSLNPNYMQEHCPIACRRQADLDRDMAEEIGYTESHYRGLVELYNQFKESPVGFNILAFPCNQFGEQDSIFSHPHCFICYYRPEKCPAIKRFAKAKGVEFTMMNKIDVNGIDAHPVYHYLKKVAGPPRITWNFATYYIVTPEGVVASMSGVEPMGLAASIMTAMGADDSSDDEEDAGEL
ncbi:hypothetical protein ACHAXR_013250 [Thalassiosira sp. AJA248-18]